MHPSPDPTHNVEPVLEILETLAATDLHQSAWIICQGKGWYFGHGSHPQDTNRFWKLDLDDDVTFTAIWEGARGRCEELAGGPLRVIRQYANGHTYGLGGNPHLDDKRPGTFTLLYYPNTEWQDGWDGETFFYDQNGEIALAVRPRPNRGVFFDSRILHNGRAPSRYCPALRATVAYKLERTDTSPVSLPSAPLEQPAEPPTEPGTFKAREVSRDGAARVYRIFVPSTTVDAVVLERLNSLAQSVRLPGFRDGNIPEAVLRERYGSQTRSEVLKRLVAESIERALPKNIAITTVTITGPINSGDLDFQVEATYLPDLPSPDPNSMKFERLECRPEDAQALGISTEDAGALCSQQLKMQILDYLDASYAIPQSTEQVQRELDQIWKAAAAQGQITGGETEKKALMEELRSIAERRLRLGVIVTELARRFEIQASQAPELEELVIARLVAMSQIQERVATLQELREMSQV